MNSAATLRREYDALGQMIHPWINFFEVDHSSDWDQGSEHLYRAIAKHYR